MCRVDVLDRLDGESHVGLGKIVGWAGRGRACDRLKILPVVFSLEDTVIDGRYAVDSSNSLWKLLR